MQKLGIVESLWRYPVKSMRGEELSEAFAGFAGIYGDRSYWIRTAAGPAGFPFLTGRDQAQMIRFAARFASTDKMRRPPNLDEADALGPGVTPVYAEADETAVDVESPEGEKFSIEDPALLTRLSKGLGDRHRLTVVRSDRSMTDCRPLSLFGTWTARQMSLEVGIEVDPRRFRANIYVDFLSQRGFAEDELVGHTIRIGNKVMIAVLERDPRCKMITLDPDSADSNPELMRRLARDHDGKAGVYAAVLVEGILRTGDEVTLLD
ncbi:MAG: MOSC domain-containing protein [Bryobacteraceae bacterium]